MVPLEAEIEEYRTVGGSELPITINTRHGFRIAIAGDDSELPSEKSLKSLAYFKKKHSDACLLAVHCGNKSYISPKGVLCISRRLIP